MHMILRHNAILISIDWHSQTRLIKIGHNVTFHCCNYPQGAFWAHYSRKKHLFSTKCKRQYLTKIPHLDIFKKVHKIQICHKVTKMSQCHMTVWHCYSNLQNAFGGFDEWEKTFTKYKSLKYMSVATKNKDFTLKIKEGKRLPLWVLRVPKMTHTFI